MKVKYTILLIAILITQSCQQVDFDLTPMNYEITNTFDSGYDIQTEGNNPNDNIIFSSCNSYVYEYIIERDGKEYFGKYLNKSDKGIFDNWDFIEKSKSEDSTYIQKFIYVQPKFADGELSPNQSVIKVYWINSDNTLLSDNREGIIENHKNLWMHPLRGHQMYPTFTAPWPFVKFPITIGDKYTWWKKLGGSWGSDKYIQWDKIIHFDYLYEVTGTEVLLVNDYKIECYKIEAKGNSEIGNTKVDFYFNPKLGFIKLDYSLMDNSKIEMTMVDFELDCDKEYEIPKFANE
jgi:hypothetical protein